MISFRFFFGFSREPNGEVMLISFIILVLMGEKCEKIAHLSLRSPNVKNRMSFEKRMMGLNLFTILLCFGVWVIICYVCLV